MVLLKSFAQCRLARPGMAGLDADAWVNQLGLPPGAVGDGGGALDEAALLEQLGLDNAFAVGDVGGDVAEVVGLAEQLGWMSAMLPREARSARVILDGVRHFSEAAQGTLRFKLKGR